ncbi:MAG: tetratricopeptide repeat protein [Stagnimonas sp.]|nr:tetratricopeptide repeat protein [Stagnimonas sp.]
MLETRATRAAASFALPLLLLWATAHATAAQAATEPLPSLRSPQAQAQFHVLAGEMAAGRQMPEMAAQEFLRALEFTADADLAARATAMALAAKREDLALTAARKWLAADASSLEAREVLARLSLRAGNGAEALLQCEAIIQGHPGGEADGYRHVALLLSQDKDSANAALNLLKQLVTQKPQLAAAQRALALLAFRFEDVALAEKSAREALRLAPGDREASLLLVGALVKKGDIAAADAVFDSLVRDQKKSSDLRMGYAKLLIDAGQQAQAKLQLGLVLKAEPTHADAHFALALLLLDERKLDEAETHLRGLLGSPERRHDAAYYLGRLAELRKQPDAALGWYEKVQAGNQSFDAYLRRARLLAELNRVPEARELLATLREQFPPLTNRLYAAEGELLSQQGDYAEALGVYDGALADAPDDSELLYARALLHERMQRVDLAEADLRKLISDDGNDGRALNALGYMLTVHSARYDEAAKLIARASELNPNDPAVLDSLGWVLFKQGRPREALPHLVRAYELFQDGEVAAHLGEVLWTLGEKDRARALWDAALRAHPEHKVLRDTVQRLSGR